MSERTASSVEPGHDHLDALAARVSTILGVGPVTLVEVPAGTSRRGFRVQAADQTDGSDEGIAFLRLDDGSGGLSGTEFDLPREATLLRALRRCGVPVPEVFGTFDDPPGVVMELVPGTPRLDADVIDRVAPEYLRQIARLHELAPADLGFADGIAVRDAIAENFAWWAGHAADHGLGDDPLCRAAMRLLGATIPDVGHPACCLHSDVGAGNFMVVGDRLSSILDWEMAHLGDPHEDLAWLWIRGAHSSFGDPERRFAEYASFAGRPIDRELLRWHVAFVIFKSVVGLDVRLRRDGDDPHVFLVHIAGLTYRALLGWALAGLAGRPLRLLAEPPVEHVSIDARLLDRVRACTPALDREQGLVVDHLRLAAAQSTWRETRLADDLHRAGTSRAELLGHIDTADDAGFADVVYALAAHADGLCQSLPNAVRRIERAQHIGLGT